jgi:hypothetical protein
MSSGYVEVTTRSLAALGTSHKSGPRVLGRIF